MSGAEVCMCVWHSEKGRNYSLALYFALSASLLILMFNNSGANAELQISSRKNQINWPSSQASCQSLGWCVNDSPRTPNSTAQYCTERKKKQRSRAKHSIKTKLPSACQLVEHLNHAKLSELTSPNCTISHSTRLLSLHPLCNFTVSLKLEINIGLCGFSSSEARIMALLWLLLLHQKKKYL